MEAMRDPDLCKYGERISSLGARINIGSMILPFYSELLKQSYLEGVLRLQCIASIPSSGVSMDSRRSSPFEAAAKVANGAVV